jgi:hypothetical protein
MKKLIGSLVVLALLPMALMVGCSSSNPSDPSHPGGGFGTPTFTATPQATAQSAQAMVVLGTAANYGVLAATGITNTGATTVCGGLACTNPAVPGSIVVICGGATDVNNTAATNAEGALGSAYTDASLRTGGAVIPAGGDIGGKTLFRGLYTDLGDLHLLTSDMTFDAQGDSNAVFIIQVTGNLIVASARKVNLINGAKAANIFWQVTGYCSLDTTSAFAGNVMAHTAVTFNTGATLEGRALAQTANVTFLANNITFP